MINWKNVRYFTEDEFEDAEVPGSGQYIDGVTLMLLDNLRDKTGWPIWVQQAVDMGGSHGHAPNSYHLLKNGCKAVDWHFGVDVPVRVQIHQVLMSPFTGIGLYFDWHIDGKPLAVGFHTDTRAVEKTQLWRRDGGKYVYLIQ